MGDTMNEVMQPMGYPVIWGGAGTFHSASFPVQLPLEMTMRVGIRSSQ